MDGARGLSGQLQQLRQAANLNWVGLMGGFYILVLVVEQNMVTKWYQNWFLGLILGTFYTIFRA